MMADLGPFFRIISSACQLFFLVAQIFSSNRRYRFSKGFRNVYEVSAHISCSLEVATILLITFKIAVCSRFCLDLFEDVRLASTVLSGGYCVLLAPIVRLSAITRKGLSLMD